MKTHNQNQEKVEKKYNAVVIDMVGTIVPMEYYSKTIDQFIKSNVGAIAEKTGKTTGEISDMANNGIKAEKGSDLFNNYLKMSEVATGMSYDANIPLELYSDVKGTLQELKESGVRVVTYASGSKNISKKGAQSASIDNYIEEYYSTEVGKKNLPQSFKNIADNIEVPVEKCLYIADSEAETEAATLAGFGEVIFLDRKGKYDKKQVTDKLYRVENEFSSCLNYVFATEIVPEVEVSTSYNAETNA